MTQATYPKVVLVGRTNVGKSTLFNRLAQEKKSIVFEREGVTRDYIQTIITWDDKTFELIDTGGISYKKSIDDIWKQVQEKVFTLLTNTQLILFVCDGKNGLIEEDRQIAKLLHKVNRPTVLLLNKADNQNALNENMHDFYALGFKTIIPVSGIHGIGISTVLNLIVQTVTTPEEISQELSHKITIIGKPNVGKSSLMNLLAQYERSIVSPIAGTTREAVTHTVFHCSDLVQLTDTAGVRRHARVDDDLEELMVKSSLQTVRCSDTVLVMIDASQGKISDQELKLLFYAYEQKKYILAIFNKTDLLDDYSRLLLEQSLEEYEFIFDKIPHLRISCLTKKNVIKVWEEIEKIWQRSQQIFNSTEVNELVQEELKTKPLFHSGFALKVFKIRHIQSSILTFVLHVNHPRWFGQTQIGCIENIIRRHYDLKGCPIQFSIRET